MIDIKKLREDFDKTAAELARRGVEKERLEKARELDAKGKRIPEIANVRSAMRLVRVGEKGSLSKGGMDSKLRAVKAAVASGIDTYIANGRKTVLAPLLAGKSVGTFFPGSAL